MDRPDLGEPRVACGPPPGTKASALVPGVMAVLFLTFSLAPFISWLLQGAATPFDDAGFVAGGLVLSVFSGAFSAAAFRLWGRALVAYQNGVVIRVRSRNTVVLFSEVEACDLVRDKSLRFPENSLLYSLWMKTKRVRVRLRVRGGKDIDLSSAGWDPDGLEKVALYVRSRLRRPDPQRPPEDHGGGEGGEA